MKKWDKNTKPLLKKPIGYHIYIDLYTLPMAIWSMKAMKNLGKAFGDF